MLKKKDPFSAAFFVLLYITLVLIAPLERGGIAAKQVARQDSLVLELPAVTVAFAHGTY